MYTIDVLNIWNSENLLENNLSQCFTCKMTKFSNNLVLLFIGLTVLGNLNSKRHHPISNTLRANFQLNFSIQNVHYV